MIATQVGRSRTQAYVLFVRRRISICLAGAAITIFTAVASAIFIVPEEYVDPEHYAVFEVQDNNRSIVLDCFNVQSAIFIEIYIHEKPNLELDSLLPQFDLKSGNSRINNHIASEINRICDGQAVLFAGIDARGWPWPAMWCRYEFAESSPCEIKGGIPIYNQPWRSSTFAKSVPRAIPMRIFVVPFIWNTIFYWIILEFIVVMLIFVRCRYRRKCGRCECCGYNVGHVDSRACPECGAIIRRIRVSTT